MRPLTRLEGESDTFCTNLDCPAQRVQRIAHFASRSAMDIEGLGEQRVELFVGRGVLDDVADLYRFTPETFDGMEGFADRSVANLLGAIDESRARPAQPRADRAGHPPPGPGRVGGPGPGVRTAGRPSCGAEEAELWRRWTGSGR